MSNKRTKPPLWPSLSPFLTPLLLARLFQQYDLNEIPDKHKDKLMW